MKKIYDNVSKISRLHIEEDESGIPFIIGFGDILNVVDKIPVYGVWGTNILRLEQMLDEWGMATVIRLIGRIMKQRDEN